MPLISNRRIIRWILICIAMTSLDLAWINSSYGQEPADSMQKELNIIAARLKDFREAGETKLADQYEASFRKMVERFEKSMEQKLPKLSKRVKTPVQKSLEIARRESIG